jgi:hypothetical protein
MTTRHLPENCRDLVELQHGVISRRQALDAGIEATTVRSILRSGRWVPVHRGVYLIHTGEPDREGTFWAALLRAGPHAMLSHFTAAEVAGLIPPPAGRRDRGDQRDQRSGRATQLVHLSVPRDQHVLPIAGAVLHRRAHAGQLRQPAALPPRTRIEETTLDLALGEATLDDAFGWLARACGSRLTTAIHLDAALARRPRVRWRRELTAVLADIAGGAHSLLELKYLRGVERPHGLPEGKRQRKSARGPHTQYRDVLYEQFGVCVETDGSMAHPLDARLLDRQRDNAAAVGGLVTLRYGWLEVSQHPCLVAAEVAAVLRTHGWAGPATPCSPACAVSQAGSGQCPGGDE